MAEFGEAEFLLEPSCRAVDIVALQPAAEAIPVGIPHTISTAGMSARPEGAMWSAGDGCPLRSFMTITIIPSWSGQWNFR